MNPSIKTDTGHVIQMEVSSSNKDEARSVANYADRKNEGEGLSWDYCAKEGETCQCDGHVRYGRDDRWSHAMPVSGEVGCNNMAFGDPYKGVVKSCYCAQFWNFENEHTAAYSTTLFTDAQASEFYNSGITADWINCDLQFRVQRDDSQSLTKFSFMTLHDGKIFNVDMSGRKTNHQHWTMPNGDCKKITCYDYEQSHPRGRSGYCPQEFYDGTTQKEFDFLLLSVEFDPYEANPKKEDQPQRNKYTFKGTSYKVEVHWEQYGEVAYGCMDGGSAMIDQVTNQATLSDCKLLCESTEGCNYITFFDSSTKYCRLMTKCDKLRRTTTQPSTTYKITRQPYTHIKGNKNTCESNGLVRITTKEECSEAAELLGYPTGSGFSSNWSRTGVTGGCLFEVDQQDVDFNSNVNNNKDHNDRQVICKRA